MPNRTLSAQSLVFGGLMAALMLLFALVPMLAILVPIPLVVMYIRFGLRPSLVTAAAVVLLVAMTMGFVQAMLLIPVGLMPGLVIGFGFSRQLRALQVGLIALTVYFLAFGVQYGYARFFLTGGQDPIAATLQSDEGQAMYQNMREQWQRQVATLFATPAGATAEQEAQFEQTRTQLLQPVESPSRLFWTLMPVAVMLLGSVQVYITYQIARLVVTRLGHPLPKPTPFAELVIPGWVAAVYFLLVVAMQSMLQQPQSWWFELNALLYFPFTTIMYVIGLAVIYGWLRKHQLTKLMAVGVVLVAHYLLRDSAMQMFAMIAIIDPMLDVRGLGHGWFKRPPEEAY